MVNEENLSLEQMREERYTFEAIYVKFVNSRKYYKSYAFCFYEGEDGKYYDSRIRQKFEDKFITYPVGNKKEVLKLLKRIKTAGLYDNVCMMFFVDRDCDISMMGTDEDLFETPCYSIENLYAQKESLIKILQSEFCLNMIEEDCQRCLQDFELREREFNNYILEFNSLVYLRRKKSGSNSNCSFGSIKTSHMVKVDVDKISKATKYDETINKIKGKLQVEEDEIEDTKNYLTRQGSFSLNFRGKNQLDFFVEFIRGLKKLNDIGGYFSIKHNNIHINITSNRLSELSQYAVVPTALEGFLEIHRNKFIKLTNVS